jgi:Zn-finger nucleic acid-binding protein
MAPVTTSTDICSHCGIGWRAGWTSCHRCGARASLRAHALSDPSSSGSASGLELDERAVAHVRSRRAEPPEAAPVLADSEAPTRELAPESPAPVVGAMLLVRVTQLLAAGLAAVLVFQMLWPQRLPALTRLLLASFNGAQPTAWQWALASAPWVMTGLMLAAAVAASERALERTLVRSVALAALAAVAPVVLLWGWESLHGHLAAALLRRGARRRASLLLGWSRAVLVLLGAEVLLSVVGGLGLAHLPPGLLAVAGALALAARQGHLCALCTTLPAILKSPSAGGTPLPSRLRCPDCGEDAPTLLRFREGLVGSACPQCSGALLGPGQVTSLLAQARVEGAAYEREVRLGAPGMRPIPCPQCASSMRQVQLRSVLAHGCPGCGSLWLARGGLPRLTGGRAVPFAGAAPVRNEVPVAGVGPALAAAAAILLALAPWMANRAGWCLPEQGACASVPASATME